MISSDYSDTATDALAVDTWWLSDPTDEDDDGIAIAMPADSWVPTPHSDKAVHYPKGADYAVVLHGDTYGIESPLVVRALGEDTYADLKARLAATWTILLRNPLGQVFYVEVSSPVSETPLRLPAKPYEPFPIRHAHVLSTTVVETGPP